MESRKTNNNQKKEKHKKKRAHKYRQQVGGFQRWVWGMGKMGEDGQKVQTSSDKISKFWGCDVQHGDCS